MLTAVKFNCIPWVRASSIVIASILLTACGGKSVEIVDITDTGVTESQIVQTKVFDQCASASALKAEVQFSKSNEQESAKELIIKGGIEGEAAIPFTAKAQLEGGVETHLKSLNSETTGHQESTMIEVPAHSQQEYAITWREIYRKGEISYIENGQTKVATFSARIGVELAKTTVRDLGCPDQVASNQLSTPIPTYTAVPATETATDTSTPLPPTATLSATPTLPPPTSTATPKPTNTATATQKPTNTATPTFTKVPATRTPTKTPTRKPPTITPTRTKTPVPPTRTRTKTPTPVFALYDDFQIGAAFNTARWKAWDSSTDTTGVSQKDSALRLQSDRAIQLVAREFVEIQQNKPFFYEAKLLLSKETEAGSISFKIHGDLPSSNWWTAGCGVYGEKIYDTAWAFCSQNFKNKEGVPTKGKDIRFDTWHTFRLEFIPSSSTVTFYLDGQSDGTFTVPNLEQIRFTFVMETFTNHGPVVGDFDYIEFGLLK